MIRSAISPTTMLSVLEYSYRAPGRNTSLSRATQEMILAGDTYAFGAVWNCFTNPSDLV